MNRRNIMCRSVIGLYITYTHSTEKGYFIGFSVSVQQAADAGKF